MFKNIVLVSLRNLLRNRTYAVLNILGLTLGITCALLIGLYIADETGYDSFHYNGDRVCRIITTISEGGSEKYYPSTQLPMADELTTKYSAVENAVRFIRTGRELFEVPDRELKFYEEGIYYADPSVFSVFTFPLISGDFQSALVQPFTAVITQSTAERYFGTIEAIGKTFVTKGKTYTVTGVAYNVPGNSSITFDALLSIRSFPLEQGTWESWYPDTYVLIAGGSARAHIEQALSAIVEEHVAPIFKATGVTVGYWLQPLTDLHLNAGYSAEGGDSTKYIYIFVSVAVFIVILTGINYVNLSTARGSRRAKEIGIRKTIGSTKANIIMQFMMESIMLTLVSLLISVVLTLLMLPLFNTLSGKSIDLSFLIHPTMLTLVCVLILVVGPGGGVYPALFLSGFNPAAVLKGNVSRGSSNAVLRKMLVSVQFAVSIAMIICTSVVYDQLRFMQTKDLGFNRDQVLHIELSDSATMASEQVLYDKLISHSRVSSIASSSSMPGKGINYTLMQVEAEEGLAPQGVYHYYVDYDFPATMGFAIVNGRDFSRDFASDSTAALVNEAMVRSMNWKDPIGKRLYEDDGNPDTRDRYYTVVGVIRDFHQNSLHSPIAPLTLFRSKPNYFLNVKISSVDIGSTLKYIAAAWREITDGKPFAYDFLDESFQKQYASDEKRGQIFSLFSIACVVISCVGLFGLAAYTTEQRAKEISIRKVVGAPVTRIIGLFYADFLKLVAVGAAVALPVSYVIMNNWISTFAYQTEMNWFDFVVPAIATTVITMCSIAFYAVRAATINPVVTLKSE